MRKYIGVRPWAGGGETTIRAEVRMEGNTRTVKMSKRQRDKVLKAGGYHGERAWYQICDAWRGSGYVDASFCSETGTLTWECQAGEI